MRIGIAASALKRRDFFHYDPSVEQLTMPDGTPITDKVTEYYAGLAEAQGPPECAPLSPQINITLPATVNATLRERAAAEHISVSLWAQRLIERELARS